MKALAKKQKGHDMVLFCIMSHGKFDGPGQEILFSDGEFVKLDDLIAPLMECQDLINCPKIGLIQACRGNFNETQGIASDNPVHHKIQKRIYHSTRDRFIIHAAAPGNEAWNDVHRGSFFIDNM